MEKTLVFGQLFTGRHAMVSILENSGLYNDVERALNAFHQLFGITDALKNLVSVHFHNGFYKFTFKYYQGDCTESWEQLVRFVLVFDWDSPMCKVQFGDQEFSFENSSFERRF